MAKEIRLLGFGVGSRMTQQPQMGPEGPVMNDDGFPVMVQVLELMFVDQVTNDMYILPLTEAGVEAVKRAINPSSVIIAAPGAVKV